MVAIAADQERFNAWYRRASERNCAVSRLPQEICLEIRIPLHLIHQFDRNYSWRTIRSDGDER